MLSRPLARAFFPSFVLACVLGAGCGGSNDNGAPSNRPDEIEYELFSSTRVLRDNDLASLAMADDRGMLVFASEPSDLASVEVGDVLLGGLSEKTPAGLLRVVTSVERTDGGLVLSTAAAPLQVAFRKLHARMLRTADPAAVAAPVTITDTTPLGGSLRPQWSVASGSSEKSQRYDVVLFDGDGNVETKNDQIALYATLGGGFTYELSIDVDWGAVTSLPQVVTDCLASVAKIVVGEKPSCSIEDLVPELKATFDVDPFVTLDVNARGAATLAYDKSFDVGTIALPPVPLGPLVFVPTIDILAKIEGGASARFDVGASARAQLTSSVTISSKTGGQPRYAPPKVEDYDVKARPPVVDLHASAKAQVGARLNVSLYGIAGPYATASAVAQIDAAPLASPCWKLRFALEADIGARITSPRLPLLGYVTLVDWRAQPVRPFDAEVANGTCEIPPDPPLAPGSGPTAKTYQVPTFETWAKVLGGSVDGTAAPAIGSLILGSPDLTPTIDGRWVAGGAFANGLHKIDDVGGLTWTSRFVTQEGTALRTLRSVPTREAGIVALLRPEGTTAFVLVKTGQSGTLETARAYDLPSDCIARVTHLARDEGDGFVVFGECQSSARGWLVRLDAGLNVIRAQTLEEDGAVSVVPIAATTSERALVVAGTVAREGELDWTFAVRLDAEDRATSSTAFTCPDRLTMAPTSLAPSEGGGVTVVGSANGLGYVARVREDGVLGFARFPNLGTGVPAEFIVSSVAELPTTGMIVAASTGNVSESAPTSIVLAGLDAAGHPLWGRRYAVSAPSARALAFPAVRLTDDGGALVAAIAGPDNGRDGDLVAMKVHAKDGHLAEGTAVTSENVTLGDEPLETTTRPFGIVMNDLTVTTKPIVLERR
ncbi:MAG TPA: hypothetical protein VM580_18720 [Labilithrix sp.]|nr:hypothetical protein [Labilithrix sp.]